MHDMSTSFPGLTLIRPDPDRDAPFALTWFTSPGGKDTLLNMGNAESEIKEPSLERERAITREFLLLEEEGKQLTWMMQIDNITIGAVWIELAATDHVKSPAAHLMIGNSAYRGRGIGTASMRAMANYAHTTLGSPYLYSRHLASNTIVMKLNHKLGFEDDGSPYVESNGLVFQNVKLAL